MGLPQHLVSRRTVLGGSVALTAAAALPGCALGGRVAAVAFNPAVQSWFRDLSVVLGAEAVLRLAEHDVNETVAQWRAGMWDLYHTWFPDVQDNACVAGRTWLAEDGAPQFQLVQIPASIPIAGDACTSGESLYDPLTDICGVVIDKGSDGFYLPAWSWQSLAMFAHEQLDGLEGADLHQKAALLKVSLAPRSSQTETNQSWAKAVSYVSYETHLGPVDIAKVENPDHTYKGLLKISGFPDQVGASTVWEFDLPTRAAD